MASGHVNRANRPNTWPLRPTPQSEDSPCQPGAVHTWPISEVVARLIEVRSMGRSGLSLLTLSFPRFDSKKARHRAGQMSASTRFGHRGLASRAVRLPGASRGNMRRREFIGLVGGAAASSVVAQANFFRFSGR